MEEYRDHFPSLKRQRNGKPPIYLDNACTTLVPQPVIDSINKYYSDFPACGGRRSHHWFAEEVTGWLEGNAENSYKGARRHDCRVYPCRIRERDPVHFKYNSCH